MATCNAYPKFEANQVLTAEQLNRLVLYLNGQDLLTRRKLIGIGPYCGLSVSLTAGASPTLHISSGCGITSEGDLVVLPHSDVTRYRIYVDPVDYPRFRSGAGQFALWELRTAAETTADDGSQPLSPAFLLNKIILLYLECREIDLKTCAGEDCDESGRRVETCVKKLVVDMADAETILQEARSHATAGNDTYPGKYQLPQLRIGRAFGLLSLGERITAADLVSYYRGMMTPLLDDLSQAYDLSYQTYTALLRNDFNQNPFEAERFRKTLAQVIKTHPQHYQYVYDFLKDLIDAYDEFRRTAFDLAAACCPDAAHFPKHLMLGPAVAGDACAPSVYRQPFIPAPIFGQQGRLGERCRLLFKKMALLPNSFKVPVYRQDRIRITPGRGGYRPLSHRSIPYYYSGSTTLHQYWNFGLTRRCQADHQLSYHADRYAPEKPAFIRDPLAFEWDDYSFLRVEGHIGGRYTDVTAEIDALIKRYNLPIQLVALKLDARKGVFPPDIRVFEDLRTRLTLAADVLGLKRGDIDVLLDNDRLVSKMGLSAATKPKLIKSLKTADLKASTLIASPLIRPGELKPSTGITSPVGAVTSPPTITGAQPDKTAADAGPACRYQDLEALYAALRSELRCLLEKETQFFGNLKFDDKEKTYSEGETGFIGSIRDLKGQPLPNAEVTIRDSRFKNAVAKGSTAADGTFDFKDLQPGKYYVDVKYGDLEISKELVDIQDKQTLGIDYLYEAEITETAPVRKSPVGGIAQTTFSAQLGAKRAAAPESPTATRAARQPMAFKPASAPMITKGTLSPSGPAAPTGFTLTRAPLTTLKLSSATVLDKGLRQPATKNTIGEFYKELDKSTVRKDEFNFSYDFFGKYPFADRTKIPEVFARQIKAPLALLDSFDQLDKTLPDGLVAFDFEAFGKSFAAMIAAAEEYRQQIDSDFSELSHELKGNEDEILIHLDRLLAACSRDKFEALYEVYTARQAKLDNLIRFAAFIREHPGIEHQAGVPKGGTLIIVYDSKDTVVADFYLPYICCSECPQVAVGAPMPVVFKLPRSEFCKSDPNRYKVITNVPGQTVNGPGIEVDETTGDSYFRPAADDVPQGTVRWTYAVAHQTYTFEALIIEADATFSHEVTVDEVDPSRALASFSATTADAKTYDWDFGDGGDPSTLPNPTHTYTLTDTEKSVEVTLTIHRDVCISSHTATIVLPAAALEPLEINIDPTQFCRDDENRYPLSVSPADPDGTVISSNGGVAAEGGSFFFVPSTADIDIGPMRLTYLIGSRSASLTVDLLNPQAGFIVGEPLEQSPGTYEVAFTNTSANADTFAWTFGDGQTSSETSPVMQFSDVSAGQEFSVNMSASLAGLCPDTRADLVKIPVPTELTITLEKSRFCKREDKEYAITVDPVDASGVVSGDGVASQEGGFFFNPTRTAAASGPITLTYRIADSAAETTIQLLNPTANFTVAEPTKVSPGVYEAQFTNTSVNANTYAWQFGDGQTSAAVSPPMTFKDVAPGQILPVTLTASVDGACAHAHRGTVAIPLDLSISLDDTVFCKLDDSQHAIKVAPVDTAGEVTGPGVAKVADQFVFIPADDKVVVGKNILTYRLGSRSTSTTVTVANPQAGFTADFSRPDLSTYTVQIKNTSTDASTFKWSILPPRMATPIIFTDREPVLDLPDTKPGDPLKIVLEASLNGRCPDLAEDTLQLPDIPPETVPPPSEIDVVAMIDRDLLRLQKMPGDPLFEVTFKSTSNRVFAGTLEFLSGLKKDLADPDVFRNYQKGVHNDELAERFDALFQAGLKLVDSFQGAAAPEQRQYVYILVQMLIELLISLEAFQVSDLATGSALFGVLNKTIEMISQLLELRVKPDPDGNLDKVLEAALTAAQDQPNVLGALKKIAELIR
jgi:PKD repeat protein